MISIYSFSGHGRRWELFMIAMKERKLDFARAIIEPGSARGKRACLEESVMTNIIECDDRTIIDDLWQAGLHTTFAPEPLLAHAVKRGRMGLFWTILESYLDDEIWSIAGQVAIECENLPLLDQLIARGTRPDDDNILQFAVLERPSMVRPLLERYRKVYPQGYARYGRVAINLAIDEYPKSSKILDIFFVFGLLDGEMLKGMGKCESPLYRAIGYGKYEYGAEHPRKDLIERLLEACGDVNSILNGFDRHPARHELPGLRKPPRYIRAPHWISDGGGETSRATRTTALLRAIKTGNPEVVQLLIEKGAEVNKPAGQGIRRTPLQQAAEENNVEIVKLLLENNADVNAPPPKLEGATALQFAAIHGNCHMAMMLMDHGARLDVPPPIWPCGRWPLEGAAEHGRIDMIRLLWDLNNGPFDDQQCQRAIRLAEINGHFGCRDMINELSGRPPIQYEI
ncbi:ankyrin repeat-containing domain protein [Xylaria digitata]|nr:ankyrin repeat-containing domain protein [Xylaria digitata]